MHGALFLPGFAGPFHIAAMMSNRIPFAVAVAFAVAAGAFADTLPSADEVLAKARTKAVAAHKNIFVVFDASW